MTVVTETNIKAGQAVYTKLLLKIYNILVLDISNRWIWRCPKRYQLRQYNQCVTTNHLDIGVGTGYYLKHCNWPALTCLSLMDLNPTCLTVASKAAHALAPQVYQADIFKSQEALGEQFTSISMNYLLHCLPGSMDEKAIVIANAAAMLKRQGILFGATILSDDHLQTGLSRRLAGFYNKKSIFSNQQDDFASLNRILNMHLKDVEIKLSGCVALFRGTKG